jgi:hypothetical protein
MYFKIYANSFWSKIRDTEIAQNMRGHISEFDLTDVLGLQYIKTDYEQNTDLIMLNFYISDERMFLMSRIKYGF